jgi:signal transduction histidine kinase
MPLETHGDLAKDVFFQHISHDIRGAYFGVGSICALIYEKVAAGEGVPLRLAQSLMDASGHYKGLLNQFLEFSRFKMGTIGELQNESFDPAGEVRQIVELNSYLAGEKHIGVHLRVDERFPATIVTDKWKITRIFYNVFVNALKFSPPDSLILIGFGVDASFWTLRIADQGKGIGPEKLERLFQPLKTEGPADNPEEAGLGLYITGYLTRLLGGEVCVDSKPGQGTSFTFRFPLRMNE